MTHAQQDESGQQPWPGGIAALTLVTEDLEATRQFYLDVFEVSVVFEDDSSAVFAFGGTLVNLLRASEAPEVVAPLPVAEADAGVRSMLTLEVADLDATAARLTDRGVVLVNGPVDRPWGIRTASFRDPSGQLWEIAGPVRPEA